MATIFMHSCEIKYAKMHRMYDIYGVSKVRYSLEFSNSFLFFQLRSCESVVYS